MKKIPLYIDTDMGADDIVALCMIIASNRFDIRGMSVVNGVSSLTAGVANLNRILTYLGITCPIFVGANQKEQGSRLQFPKLDRTRANQLALLPRTVLPKVGRNSVLSLPQMGERIKQEKKPITFFAIGPLTNVSVLLSSPQTRKKIRSLVIMGGTINARGIVPPTYTTEYNIALDPISAKKIFESSLPITLVPLDGTQYVPTKVEDVRSKKRFRLKQWYKDVNAIEPKQKEGLLARSIILENARDFSYFYDPLAAAILIEPSVITAYSTQHLTVLGDGKLITTNTINGPKTIYSVNSNRFYTLVQELIQGRKKERKN